jgi:hypothetical protein
MTHGSMTLRHITQTPMMRSAQGYLQLCPASLLGWDTCFDPHDTPGERRVSLGPDQSPPLISTIHFSAERKSV